MPSSRKRKDKPTRHWLNKLLNKNNHESEDNFSTHLNASKNQITNKPSS